MTQWLYIQKNALDLANQRKLSNQFDDLISFWISWIRLDNDIVYVCIILFYEKLIFP